jgi:hypothetical protein
MDADDLVKLLRERCLAEGGAYRFAKNHEVSDQYVSNVLSGKYKPGPKIAMALGLKKVITFEPIK